MNTNHFSTDLLAATHRSELEREAEQARLAAEVAGARPGVVGTLLAAVGGWLKGPEPAGQPSPQVGPAAPARG
jgi:hypothetical protein